MNAESVYRPKESPRPADEPPAFEEAPRGRPRKKALIALVAGLVLMAVAAAAYINRDKLFSGPRNSRLRPGEVAIMVEQEMFDFEDDDNAPSPFGPMVGDLVRVIDDSKRDSAKRARRVVVKVIDGSEAGDVYELKRDHMVPVPKEFSPPPGDPEDPSPRRRPGPGVPSRDNERWP